MMVVLITGLKNDFDKKLAAIFVREKYKVFAIGNANIEGVTLLPSDLKEAVFALQSSFGDNEGLDIYADVSDERCPREQDLHDDFNVRGVINDKIMRELYEENVLRPMAMLEAFIPLLEAGKGRRLCYLTSAQASINETRGTDGYGYKMAKAGLHNFLQITRNVLAPRGYTIRVYDPIPHEAAAEASAEAAFNYFTRRRGIERGDPQRDDEDNLVFRDAYGRQHTW
jgi:NAD(P)-dependent dehydrogenase (short-subunit alcohol dehydrogenase family)